MHDLDRDVLLKEASRCLCCKVAMCRKHCPADTPVPDVIRLFREGKEQEAGELLFRNNPLSAITSIVCPHERNCNGSCVLGRKSSPVDFYEIEQYLSGKYLQNYKAPVIEKNPYRIAVIGAGPAGITASILLALQGFRVTLIDSCDRIGGVLRYGIPKFRLPKEIVDRYSDILSDLGVLFKPNTFVGSTVTLEDMFFDGYKSIFIAVGTAKPNKLGLLGETLGNVYYAIDFLKSPEAYRLGKSVAVIGAGNVALDAARMAVRCMPEGSSVTILNNRDNEDMTGNLHEIADAEAEGVKFLHCLQAIKLEEDGVKCARIEVGTSDGKKTYTEDFAQITKIPAETIILAIGQGPQGAVLSETILSKTTHGLLNADEYGRTEIPGVFAAGDIVSGPKTVVDAAAFAKKAAQEIVKYCRGEE